MCGRARCILSADTIEASTKVPKKQFQNFQNYKPLENMTPGMQFPVLYSGKDGSRELRIMTWGLVPSFTSSQIDKPDFFKIFNARLETLDEKPSFREIAKTNRCVILMSGYFEWKVDSDTGRKLPYYVSRPDGHPLCLAGVYDKWKSGTPATSSSASPAQGRTKEALLHTFSIVTAPSEASSQPGLQNLHPRQPVFLCSPEAITQWLRGSNIFPPSSHEHEDALRDHKAADSGDVTSTLLSTATCGSLSLLDTSAAPEDLVIHAVTPLMSHASYQQPDCAERITSPLKSKRMTDFFTRSPQKTKPISVINPVSPLPSQPKNTPSTSSSNRSPWSLARAAASSSASSSTLIKRESGSTASNRSKDKNSGKNKRKSGNVSSRDLTHFFHKGQEDNKHTNDHTSKKLKIDEDYSEISVVHWNDGEQGKKPKNVHQKKHDDLESSVVTLLSEEEQMRRAIAASLNEK